jgi:hypothetical protein
MAKSLKPKVGKFLVLEAPVRTHGTTKKKYVDVRGNGRLFDNYNDALNAAKLYWEEQNPIIVQVVQTEIGERQ